MITIILIKKYRKEKGITQMELAQKLEVEQNTVSQWENGIRLPRSDKLPLLAKLLGCTVDDLFKDTQ